MYHRLGRLIIVGSCLRTEVLRVGCLDLLASVPSPIMSRRQDNMLGEKHTVSPVSIGAAGAWMGVATAGASLLSSKSVPSDGVGAEVTD